MATPGVAENEHASPALEFRCRTANGFFGLMVDNLSILGFIAA